jgi:hypothetical protein
MSTGDDIAIKADGTRNIVIDKLLVYGNGDSSFAANATTNGSFYAVSYTPEHSGLHSLAATFSREGKTHHISGSPFELVVHWAPIISAIHSTVRGTGLTLSSAGVAVTFIITARDKTMNQLHSGVPAHVGLLIGRRTINDCLIVHDQASATMSIRYSTPQSGTHFFNICAGKDEGLLAQYFLDEDLKNGLFEQLDPIVDFDWRLGRPGSPLIPGDVNAGSGFGIRWTGYVTPYLPQLHTFGLEVAESDERVKLWVDEQLLVDQWNSIATIRPTGTILVCAGTAYPIRIEYFNNKGTCAASLTWESNGKAGNIVKRPIPGRFLHPVCEPFQGSPFSLRVEPGNADKYSVVTGTGLTIGTAGVSSNFIIAARDKLQNLGVLGSSDIFYGALQSSGGKSPSVLKEAAFDASRGLGRYTWTGTPYSTGMDSSLVALISSGGLGATYFDGPFLFQNKAVASSVSEVLDWSFVQEWPDMLPADSFSVRWAGYIGSRVASVCTRFLALVLESPPRFASMSSRNSAPLGSAILPVYNALGGPQGKGHVTFNRSQSQYLDAGPRTLNITTNGGLTIVAVVRFTGDPGAWERIIDMGSGSGVNMLNIFRDGTTTDLRIELLNGGSVIEATTLSGVNVQNTWLTAVVRYRASTREWWFTVNGVAASGTASASLADRMLSLTYMGRSQFSYFNGDVAMGDAYFNGDMAGVFVVDEYLSTDATSAIADAMARGEDLTTQGPCAPQVLSPLLPVALSSTDLCPPHSRSLALCRCYPCSSSLSCCEVHECPY